MAHHHGEYPLTLMCRVLSVARSTFYAWRCRGSSRRAREDAMLRVLLVAQHERCRQEYGARPHRQELAVAGHRVARRRVGRLMRASGVAAVTPPRRPAAPAGDPTLVAAPNRLDRQFTVLTRSPRRGCCTTPTVAVCTAVHVISTRWPRTARSSV